MVTSTPTASTSSPTRPSAANKLEGVNGACAEDCLQPMADLGQYLKQYASEKPEMAALWCFGVGFVLGWKLRLW